jgi:hypothetical protein
MTSGIGSVNIERHCWHGKMDLSFVREYLEGL